jgi:hypothetical protein
MAKLQFHPSPPPGDLSIAAHVLEVCPGAFRTLGREGIISVNNEFKRRLFDAIEAECLSRSTKGAFSAHDPATEIVAAMAKDSEWGAIRGELIIEAITGMGNS